MTNGELKLEKYSIGLGDRFALQAEAQLRACMLAAEQGAEVIPVWNKSNREHLIVGSEPASVREAAAAAIRKLGWRKPWHVDADHIRLETVARFLPHSDFYTIDVADSIGKPASPESIRQFVDRHPEFRGTIRVPGIDHGLEPTAEEIMRIAGHYLFAVQEVGQIFRHIEKAKGKGQFIAEVSMDETDRKSVV